MSSGGALTPLTPQASGATRRLAAEVGRRLEWLANVRQRESRFDAFGRFRTTSRMQRYDLACLLTEAVNTGEDRPPTDPHSAIGRTSARVPADAFAKAKLSRLAEQAGEELRRLADAERLWTVHRFRPSSKTPKSAAAGDVQNYSTHPASMLLCPAYCDFYEKNRLGHKKRVLESTKPRTSGTTPSVH